MVVALGARRAVMVHAVLISRAVSVRSAGVVALEAPVGQTAVVLAAVDIAATLLAVAIDAHLVVRAAVLIAVAVRIFDAATRRDNRERGREDQRASQQKGPTPFERVHPHSALSHAPGVLQLSITLLFAARLEPGLTVAVGSRAD